jgi:hypothetical protein
MLRRGKPVSQLELTGTAVRPEAIQNKKLSPTNTHQNRVLGRHRWRGQLLVSKVWQLLASAEVKDCGDFRIVLGEPLDAAIEGARREDAEGSGHIRRASE